MNEPRLDIPNKCKNCPNAKIILGAFARQLAAYKEVTQQYTEEINHVKSGRVRVLAPNDKGGFDEKSPRAAEDIIEIAIIEGRTMLAEVTTGFQEGVDALTAGCEGPVTMRAVTRDKEFRATVCGGSPPDTEGGIEPAIVNRRPAQN